MKRSTLLQTALLTCGLSFSAASFAGGASGAMLGNTCAGCHGTNGVSNGPATPSLAGLDYDYMVDAMKAFKAGERRTTIMTRIAKGYDDADIEAMSKYFSEKEFVMAKNMMQMQRKEVKSCTRNTVKTVMEILVSQKTRMMILVCWPVSGNLI